MTYTPGLNQRRGPFRQVLFTTDDARTGAKAEGITLTAVNDAVTYSHSFTATRFGGAFGFQVRWTGTVKGVLSLWFTDLDQPDVASDTDWTQDTSMTPTNPAGSAGAYGDNGMAVHRKYRFKLAQDHTTPGAGVISGDLSFSRE